MPQCVKMTTFVGEKTGLMAEVPCGQCINCRITRQMAWTARCLIEEAYSPRSSSFITLTYSPENMPEDGKLSVRHLQLFFKRLRKALPHSIRYFACGEYGGKTNRPHYHALVFGLPCPVGDWLTERWQLGFTVSRPLTKKNVLYTTRYTLKASKRGDDYITLASRNPGIGVDGLRDLGEAIGKRVTVPMGAPTTVKIGGKTWPLDARARLAVEEGIMKTGKELLPERSKVSLDLDWRLMRVAGVRENGYTGAKVHQSYGSGTL